MGADFQTPPKKLSDPNLTPLPTHPGIKYVARALAAIIGDTVFLCAVTVVDAPHPAGERANCGCVTIV